jgi:hypothetical protein
MFHSFGTNILHQLYGDNENSVDSSTLLQGTLIYFTHHYMFIFQGLHPGSQQQPFPYFNNSTDDDNKNNYFVHYILYMETVTFVKKKNVCGECQLRNCLQTPTHYCLHTVLWYSCCEACTVAVRTCVPFPFFPSSRPVTPLPGSQQQMALPSTT